MERRITKGHPDWERLNRAANDLAIAINPHMFFWGSDEKGQPAIIDIDEVERIATVEKVKDVISEHLEGGRFADWINANPRFRWNEP